MKKFLISLLLVLISACCALADTKVTIVQYRCLICEKYFYGFDGDELDSEELNDPDIQLRRVFQLADRGKNLQPCSSNFKAHVFDKKGTAQKPISEIARNMSRIAVVKDGPNLKNTTISDWVCLAPDCLAHTMYTLNNENLMITDWEQQIDKIVSIKGNRKLPKCKSRHTFGHAFFRSASMNKVPVKSYDIAQYAYDLYYVKN
ncbi:MAG: hypothetical protein IJ597_07025 [Synergistaceae bacterium]|nr:hypothetical protein [Synergistaceae bacterium]